MQSAERLLQILRSFPRARPELGVNELARELERHPSTMSCLLATLARADFVRLDPRTGRYRLGFAILELADFLLADVEVRREAQPIMLRLAERSQETVNPAIQAERDAVIIEQAAGPRYFRYVSWIRRRAPLHATAHGKVLLAFEPAECRKLVAALVGADDRFPALMPLTIPTTWAWWRPRLPSRPPRPGCRPSGSTSSATWPSRGRRRSRSGSAGGRRPVWARSEAAEVARLAAYQWAEPVPAVIGSGRG